MKMAQEDPYLKQNVTNLEQEIRRITLENAKIKAEIDMEQQQKS